jgi:cell division protein DivIC
MEVKKNKKHIKTFKIIFAIIMLLFFIRVGQQLYTIYTVRQETIKTQAKVEELKKQNEALEKEKENLGDIKYVEKIAREEHNMVGKDEIPIFIVDDQKQQDQKQQNDAQKKDDKSK